MIEHPEWTSAETYESDELYDGSDRGRIYRIVPADGLPLSRDIPLGAAPDEELVQYLDHPNIWWRRTAQRLLVDHRTEAAGSPSTTRLLRQVAAKSRSGAARVHALWTLDGISDLDAATIEAALADPKPGVRENAIILAEARLRKSADGPLSSRLLNMKDDPDPRVRFQLLCTLGYLGGAAAAKIRDELLSRDMEDSWVQIAALSWPLTPAAALLAKAANSQGGLTGEQTEAREGYFRRLGSLAGSAADGRQIRGLLNTIGKLGKQTAPEASWWRAAVLDGLATGLQGRGEGPAATTDGNRDPKTLDTATRSKLLALYAETGPAVRRAALRVLESAGLPNESAATRKALTDAAHLASDTQAGAEQRADAIRLLALADPRVLQAVLTRSSYPSSSLASSRSSSRSSSQSSSAPLEDLLVSLIDASEPEPVQAAAARAYGRLEGPAQAGFFLERWRSMTPPVRAEAAQALIRTPERITKLLDAIEEGSVQPWTLASTRNRLMMQPDPKIRERARRLLLAPQKQREKVVEQYRTALELQGDRVRGAPVFERVCSKCHLLNGVGHDVGPDLETIRGRPGYLLLNDILMPNQSIAQTYESYVIETLDGRIIDGVIGPQSPASITLRREGGEEDVIQRQDIKDMYASDLSAMAADVEEQISVQQMADLIRYIKTANH